MLKAFSLAALLTVAALALTPTSARAQVIINVGRPAPPPVVVVRETRYPKKWKGHKHHYYQPRPVMLVPARPVYYAPHGHGHGRGKGHGRH